MTSEAHHESFDDTARHVRFLLEDAVKSYHAAHRVADTDLFDSRVIFGDNLLALKALEQGKKPTEAVKVTLEIA